MTQDENRSLPRLLMAGHGVYIRPFGRRLSLFGPCVPSAGHALVGGARFCGRIQFRDLSRQPRPRETLEFIRQRGFHGVAAVPESPVGDELVNLVEQVGVQRECDFALWHRGMPRPSKPSARTSGTPSSRASVTTRGTRRTIGPI